MHRSYQSVTPCQNKLLQSRWDKQYYEAHRRKVASAGPTVDTKAPRTFLHLHLKLKKLQLEGERLATIERDNRILLEKMAYIMRTEGRINNKNDYEYKSLNRGLRERAHLRIAQENQGVLKRIMLGQAQYDHFKWHQDWEENQRYIDLISHYPREWWLMTEEGRRKYGEKRQIQTRQSERQQTPASSQRNTQSQKSTRKQKDKPDKEKLNKEKSEKEKREKSNAKTKETKKEVEVEVEVEVE